jgi:signal transduction histidine kinase
LNDRTQQLEALHEAAWQARFVDREKLRWAADEIIRLASPGSLYEAHGHFHLAVCAWQSNKNEFARHERLEAARLYEQLDDVAGSANCRDLEALAERFAGNYSRASELYKLNHDIAESIRTPAERCMTCVGEGALRLTLAEHAECQRLWSIAVSLAQKSENLGLEVSALCNLSALHITVCNFEDGCDLSRRAFELADQVFSLDRPSSMTTGWFNSGMNWLVALDCLGRHVEAVALADRIVSHEAHFPRGQAANYFVSFANSKLHAGDVEQAEIFLRKSLDLAETGTNSSLEAVTLQAEIWNLRGQYLRTCELCATWDLETTQLQRDASAYELMRFHRAATLANQALCNFETALRHEKLAFDQYEALVATSARARRLTLEIQTELQRTEWQRDQARKLRHAAELEQGRLGELNRALEAANSAKSSFLAAASHDLRQPVMAVNLLAAALAASISDPAHIQLAARIQHSASALERLLGELLDISEIDAGAADVSLKRFPISDCLIALDSEFRGIAETKTLTLRLAAGDQWVFSDSHHLLRILRNLVANALSYTERGGVLVAARRRNDSLLLEVWDTGVGIAAEHLPHLFEEFYQVSNRSRDRRKGLGLGLAVTKRLATLLNHPIEVKSRVGKGTLVRLTLPLCEGD